MATVIPPADIWATATGEFDGQVIIYRYRQNRPHDLDLDQFPSALEVRWPYDATVRNGLPPQDVNAEQVEFEDAIDALTDGSLGRLMLVATGGGRKRWLFYVRDPEEWAARLNELLASHPPYPLELPNWSEPDWHTWQRFVESVRGGS